MTRDELFARMSSAEFAAWIAYDRIQPIGDRRLDLNFAHLCALIASALSGHDRRIDEFDRFGEGKFTNAADGIDVEEQKARARAITRMLGGKITEAGGVPRSANDRGA